MTAPKKPAKKAVAVKKAAKRVSKARKPRITGKPTGRPTLLDEARVEILLGQLRLGNPIKTACAMASINDETLRQWTRKGYDALKVDEEIRSPQEKVLADFIGRLSAATAEANAKAQETVNKLFMVPVGEESEASIEQQSLAFRAATFHLTHRDPENYNTRTRMEMTGKDGAPVEVELSADEAYKKLHDLLAKDRVTDVA